jgi:4,5-dihydroxyphthalate decarboxylase
MMEAFERVKDACKHYYDDPNWSRLVWGRHLFEEERAILGEDPWPYGLKRNRSNLERFMEYSRDQGLMERALAAEELFVSTTLDT